MATLFSSDIPAYPTPSEIRDLILRIRKLAWERRGAILNVRPGSEAFRDAEAWAQPAAIAFANNKISVRDISPHDMVGDQLIRFARVFGVEFRDATPSSGFVTVEATGSVSLPAGFTGTSATGVRVKTTTAEVVSNGYALKLESTITGKETNLAAGTLVQWDNGAFGALKATCLVDDNGFTGGSDADTDEILRERLLDHLANPQVGGNWAQVKAWAESAHASILRAYVFPAVRGSGSYDVALVGDSGNGVLGSTVVNVAHGIVLGNMPGGAFSLNTTTITPQGVDISIAATLPLATSAGGAGGGWRDANPWPTQDVKVTAKSGSTLTVNSTIAPRVGASIGIWDHVSKSMKEFNVLTVGGSSGSYTITVDKDVSFVVVNSRISAGAFNLVEYADEFLQQTLALGPGEKTTNVSILSGTRGRRYPTPDVAGPSDLTNVLLARVITAHPEIINLDYTVRVGTGTSTPVTSPSVPGAPSSPPQRLTLQHFSIRKA